MIKEIGDMIQRELVEVNHRCEHEGCSSFDTIQCRLVDWESSEKPYDISWYCGEHCHSEGFCWMCGEFWGGNEFFDFNKSGLCENCQFETDSEMAELEDEDYGQFQEIL